MTCTCTTVYAGSTLTGARNWSPTCAEHGLSSDWYRDEGRQRFEEQNTRVRRLQAIARARQEGTAVACEPCATCEHTGWRT